MKPITRIFLIFAALALGVLILYLLTFFGSRSQGPVEGIFSGAGDFIRQAEDRLIIQRRSGERAEKISWFKAEKEFLQSPPKILLGAYDENHELSLRYIFELEEALETTFPLIQIYTAWGSKPKQQFPKVDVLAILKSGSVPVITWEPWLNDFEDARFAHNLRPANIRDKNGLNDIANGVYDEYIRTWAGEAAKIGHPIFLRFGHEMNDPYRYPWGPQNNEPQDFVAAWRHVRHICIDAGASNLIWIWSPHLAYGHFHDYFPGEAYVDWVGTATLNYGTVAPWSEWWSFSQIFEPRYEKLAAFNKPIMLSEFGSLAVGGNRQVWYHEALADLPENFPAVKSLLFFHFSADQTTTQQVLDWSFIHDPEILKTISETISTWE